MVKTILGIDTSCDDTSIAVVKKEKNKFDILSSVVSSQVKLHQKYGGVYPTLAKREHQKNLDLVLKKALKQAKLPAKPKLEAIAVTVGPGLEPCLWTGINFAKGLAKKWRTPIIPINHLSAHLLANLIGQENNCPIKNIPLPALGLVVSGGNTLLALVKKIGQYQVIGETRDDAAGECLDKTARILGLPYPGGPAIAAEAAKFKTKNSPEKEQSSLGASKLKINLPRPMIYAKNYDFSFSGLKTAALYDYQKRPAKMRKSKNYIQAMAKEIQQAVIDVLIKKTLQAAQEYQVKSILLGGGVACNQELRRQFQQAIQKQKPCFLFLVPCSMLCTDNAAMIALAGWFNQKKATKNWSKLKAKSNLKL